jgi:DNA-binding transcriptional MocR family regulator
MMILKWTPAIATRPGPRYMAIVDLLADDIAGARLKVGDRLPTHRALAERLGVTVSTVTRAYAEAERRGLISSEVGRGTFVRETVVDSAEAILASPIPGDTFVDMARDRPAAAGPAPAAIARHTVAIATNGTAAMLPSETAGGHPAHREAGADWLARRIGTHADPSRVLLAAGTQNAILLAIAGAASAGDTILCEALTSHGVKVAAGVLGVRLVGVEMDGEGMLPDALASACRRRSPKAVYLSPTFHTPTTAIMPSGRRRQIVEICRRHGTMIIEEDCYGFLDDTTVPLATLAPERTTYFSSLSKCVSSGLPAAYVQTPIKVLERSLAALRATTHSTVPLVGEIATRMIRSGDAAAATSWYRDLARRRGALARLLPDQGLIGMNEGAHQLWLRLPANWRRDDFAETARRHGVGILPGRAFAPDGSPVPNAVRVCFCAPDSEVEVRTGFERLAELLARTA